MTRSQDRGYLPQGKALLRLLAFQALLLLVGLSPCHALDEGQLSYLLMHNIYPVSQGYLNKNAVNPTSDQLHAGIDYASGYGTVVYAPASGICTCSGGTFGTLGIYCKTLDKTYLFLHLSERNFRVGDRISIGQVIGKTGSTGVASGAAHLHFECRPGNKSSAWGLPAVGSTASQTLNPLSAFNTYTQPFASYLERGVYLDARDPNRYYRIYSLRLFNPGEYTAISKLFTGNLDTDLLYSWDGRQWAYLSSNVGNEFVNSTFGSGFGMNNYQIYIAVIARSGAATLLYATEFYR